MPHDVFVSYSAKDKATADAVVAGLEQGGVRCWIAPRDVLAGTNWGKAIVDAIEAARVMVLILSDNSNRSKQVLREVERAVASETIILPFRIEAIDPTGAMAYFLATEHWLDALTPPLERHIGHLAASIRALMTGEPIAAEPTAAASTAATPTAVGPLVTARPTLRSWLRSPFAIGGLVIAVLATTGILIALWGGRSRTTALESGSDRVSTTNTATDSSTTAPPTTQSTVTQEPAPDLTLTPLMEVPIVATLTELVEAANRWGQRHDDDRAVALEGIQVLADDAGSEWAARLEAGGPVEEFASAAPAGLCQLVDDGVPPDDVTAAIAAAAAEVSGLSQADYTFARWVSSVATASVCPEQTPRWAIANGGLGGGQLFSEDYDDGAAGWLTGSFEAGIIAAENGVFRFLPNEEGYILGSLSPQAFTDMVVDVWVQQTTGPSSFNVGFGVTCRESETPPFGSFYLFTIKGYGAAEIWKYPPDGNATLLGSTATSDAIHLTPYANHLTVMCDGSSLALFANGELVLHVDDSTYTEGAVSTFAYSESLTGIEVVFDNLTISAPHPEAQTLLDEVHALDAG